MRLVVVDDDADIRLLLTTTLALEGLQVAGEAVNGAEAIEIVRRLQPDAVVLDMMMPVMDGMTALPEIKRVAPATRVILYSSADVDSVREEAERLGAHRVLPKTAGTAALMAALRSDPADAA